MFSPIGPLQDPVTWYRINYTGTQMTQWDFQNKRTLTSPAWLSFVLEVPLHHLRPSVIYSVPCDQILQRAYCHVSGVEMLPVNDLFVYLLISHNFRKWQVKYIGDRLENPEKFRIYPVYWFESYFQPFSTRHHSRAHLCSSLTAITNHCNLCSAHGKDIKCDFLIYSSSFCCWSSVNKFSISVCNMDHFRTCKQCAKTVEVEVVHLEENFKAPMMKCNNVRRSIQVQWEMERWACGCQQRMERCSVLAAKGLIKRAETNSSQAVSWCA